MGRPETWTAAALVVIGIGVALWLAAGRPPATPAPPSEPVVDLAAFASRDATRQDTFGAIMTDPAAGLGVDGLACGPKLEIDSLADGWFRVIVSAPCRTGAPLTIAHGPIVFDAVTDAKGLYATRLPVLSDKTTVAVTFNNGDHIEAKAPTGEARLLLGVSWPGPAVLRLVVDEYGRRLGDDLRGTGRVIRYGRSGPQSVVYVAPKGVIRGPIRIGVDVRGGKACGTNLAVTAYDTLAGDVARREVTIGLPACNDAPARFVLDNVLDDLGVFGPRG